jgi:5-methylcytosine-specific restriction enzyme A
MTIYYRAVHAKSPWRKVSSHKSLDSAIDGKDGAKALLLKKGRIAEKWDTYGRPLCVFVWEGGQSNGHVFRLSPQSEVEVQMRVLPISTIQKHEDQQSCSEVELKGYFAS